MKPYSFGLIIVKIKLFTECQTKIYYFIAFQIQCKNVV